MSFKPDAPPIELHVCQSDIIFANCTLMMNAMIMPILIVCHDNDIATNLPSIRTYMYNEENIIMWASVIVML